MDDFDYDNKMKLNSIKKKIERVVYKCVELQNKVFFMQMKSMD